MKTPEQIINEIKTFISTSKPFRFSGSETTVLNLLTELENTLNPQPIIEEPVVAEQNVLIKDEDGLFEEVTFIEEPVVAKKSTKKK